MNRKTQAFKSLLFQPINDEFISSIRLYVSRLNEIFDVFNNFINNASTMKTKDNYIRMLGEIRKDFAIHIEKLFNLLEKPSIFTEDAETQLKSIQLKIADLLKISELLIVNLESGVSESTSEIYILDFISKTKTFLSDFSLAIFKIEHPVNPYRAMILAGLICAFLPFINIVSLIFGIHLVRVKDYRARGFGFILLLIFFISVVSVALKIF